MLRQRILDGLPSLKKISLKQKIRPNSGDYSGAPQLCTPQARHERSKSMFHSYIHHQPSSQNIEFQMQRTNSHLLLGGCLMGLKITIWIDNRRYRLPTRHNTCRRLHMYICPVRVSCYFATRLNKFFTCTRDNEPKRTIIH